MRSNCQVRRFFCNLEGHFKSGCPKIRDAVADIKHPRHAEALSGVKARKACLLSEESRGVQEREAARADEKKMQAVTKETS